MPEIEQNIVKEDKPKKLAELKLITPGFGCVYDVKSTELLLIRDKIFNPKNQVKIKYPGYRVRVPFLQEVFVVKTGTYPVIVANQDTPDGRYNQDIGAGDDISLSIKITLTVDKSPKGLKKLMEQQETYKDATRAKTETIMKLLVNQNYQKDSHATKLYESKSLKKAPFYLENIIEEARTSDNVNTIDIAGEAIELQEKYGIILQKIEFTDVDYSERIKQIIANDVKEEHAREIALKEAQNRKAIAAAEAEAYKKKLETEIQALRENGFTNEQIAYYMNLKNLPKNAVAVVGQPKGSMVSDFVTANIAANNMSNNTESDINVEELLNGDQNTNGRSR